MKHTEMACFFIGRLRSKVYTKSQSPQKIDNHPLPKDNCRCAQGRSHPNLRFAMRYIMSANQQGGAP
jgi:hypothetical protein